jgi:hypothetical protein
VALGRIQRTLFTLQWLSDPDLRPFGPTVDAVEHRSRHGTH